MSFESFRSRTAMVRSPHWKWTVVVGAGALMVRVVGGGIFSKGFFWAIPLNWKTSPLVVSLRC